MTDGSPIVEIEGSPGKLILLSVGGVVMTALSAVVAFPPIPELEPNPFTRVVCLLGVPFFGFCTVVWFKRLLSPRGPIVTITPEGIRDTRVAAEFVPWRDIDRIWTWEYSRQQVMVLTVKDAVWNRLTLTRIARWSRGANRKLGADGLAVTAAGLKIDHATLFKLAVDHHAEAGKG